MEQDHMLLITHLEAKLTYIIMPKEFIEYKRI